MVPVVAAVAYFLDHSQVQQADLQVAGKWTQAQHIEPNSRQSHCRPGFVQQRTVASSNVRVLEQLFEAARPSIQVHQGPKNQQAVPIGSYQSQLLWCDGPSSVW